MRHLLSILCLLAAATAHAQTIKSLGYNTTNGQVVAATNVIWTNAFSFSTNTVSAQVRTNMGLGAAWLTNTNVTNFRSAIGLGATNNVTFNSAEINLGAHIYGTLLAGSQDDSLAARINSGSIMFPEYESLTLAAEGREFRLGNTNVLFSWTSNSLTFHKPIVLSQNFVVQDPVNDVAVITFQADDSVVLNAQYWNNSNVRTSLGLPLATLTNTSNADMMRALAGSTNTNHPYSGSISVVGTNNTNTLVFSNGILQEVQ